MISVHVLAAVGGLEQAAARAAARHLVLDAVRLPQRGVHHVRVLADRSRCRPRRSCRRGTAPCFHVLPPSVRLEDAALVARRAVACRSRRRTRCRGWSDGCGSSRSRRTSREADVRPRLAGVGGLVDAVARHDVAADARLAHADEDDVGVRLGDRDRADRRAVDLAVGDRRPRAAAVGRLPQAAAGLRRSTPPSAVPSRPRPRSSGRRGRGRCCATERPSAQQGQWWSPVDRPEAACMSRAALGAAKPTSTSTSHGRKRER